MIKYIMPFIISLGLAQATPFIPIEIVQGHLSSYSIEEKERIEMDLKNIREKMFFKKESSEHPTYLATVGGPGAAKSTILDRELVKDPRYVLSDPDQGALFFMINTYGEDKRLSHIANNPDHTEFLRSLYNKWRGASNYISNEILNTAFGGKYPIAHGTTSFSMPVENYKKLKEAGYRIHLLLCASSDQNLLNSISHREGKLRIVQSVREDVSSKTDKIYQRLADYFNNADRLDIYWTSEFPSGSVLAATFENKQLTIKDQEAYQAFLNDYAGRAAKLHLIPFHALLENLKK